MEANNANPVKIPELPSVKLQLTMSFTSISSGIQNMTNFAVTVQKLCTDQDLQRQTLLLKIKNAIQQLPETELLPLEISKDLKDAIELESREAIELMAYFILELRTSLSFAEKLHYLELAARYDYVDSIYLCGCIYGGLLQEPTPERYLNMQKAVFYLTKAAELGSTDSIKILLRAMWDKDPPNLIISNQQAHTITQDLIDLGNSQAALYYGMALSGFHPKEFKFREFMPKDYELAIQYLMLAYQKGDRSIRGKAIEVLQQGYLAKLWPSSYNNELQKMCEPQVVKNDRSLVSVIKSITTRFQ